ncbi:MAG: hypothetical protein HY735_21595 [Verrucomicrobia bacterium]|nr:hypothetical protein [Verrucomicrobiota bacterium]
MKRKVSLFFLGLAGCILLNGCVAIPPLINVQHREVPSETGKKLDDIDHRLKRLEDKLDKMEKR